MIQNLRDNLSGTVAITLIVLIAIPLAFFGVESIFLNSVRVNEVAEVNGETISELELQRGVSNQMNEIMGIMGDQLDPALLDEATLRPRVLEQLIQEKLVLSAAREQNLAASDVMISETIRSSEAFQVNGQFNATVFRQFLANMGYTPTTFMEAMHDQQIANFLLVGLRASAFATQKDTAAAVASNFETRSWQYLAIPGQDILNSIEISDEEVQSYYEIYQEDFRRPEELSLNYVSLSSDGYFAATAGDETLADQVLERFELLAAQQGEQKRISHIQLEANDEASAAQQVEEIQQRIADGEAFATLAAEFSVDVGTAALGGDLGYTDGTTFPAVFELAIEELEEDEVSAPVELDGYTHLILVTDLQQSDFSLENEYAAIEREVRQDMAQEQFQEGLDELRGLVFSTDNLEQLIEQFSNPDMLEIQTSLPFSRDVGTGIASDARVRAVGYSDVVLNQQFNEIVELGNSEALVVHLNEHYPSRLAELAEVQNAIVATLKAEKAGEVLAETASGLEQEIAGGATLDSVAEREGYVWGSMIDSTRMQAGQDASQLVFGARPEQLPYVSGGVVVNGDYRIYRISEITPGRIEDQPPELVAQVRERVAVDRSVMEWEAYLAALEAGARISRKINTNTAADLEL